jgi:hypothetical protein
MTQSSSAPQLYRQFNGASEMIAGRPQGPWVVLAQHDSSASAVVGRRVPRIRAKSQEQFGGKKQQFGGWKQDSPTVALLPSVSPIARPPTGGSDISALAARWW